MRGGGGGGRGWLVGVCDGKNESEYWMRELNVSRETL